LALGATGDWNADDHSSGLTLVGATVGNLDHHGPCPIRSHSIVALDEVRNRFGSAAITRAVLLGRDQGFSMPMLPD